MSSQPRSLLLVNPFTLLHYYFNTVLKFLPSLFGVAFLFLLDQFSNVPLSPCIPFSFLISFHTQQILIASPKNIEIDSGADRTTPLSPIVRQEIVATNGRTDQGNKNCPRRNAHSLRRRRNSYSKETCFLFFCSLSCVLPRFFFFFLPFRFFFSLNI